jgi:hypothetical protein
MPETPYNFWAAGFLKLKNQNFGKEQVESADDSWGFS